MPIADRTDRRKTTPVTRRTGAFGNRTRRITSTWDMRSANAAYRASRAKSGTADTIGRPTARTIAIAATPAARPTAASRLTNWKARSATRYSRGRTSAVRKKSNSEAWAVTPAPRE